MKLCKILSLLELSGEDSINYCEECSNNGADELLIFDRSDSDASHDGNISLLKQITAKVDIPYIVGGNVNRLEDVKKYLYAGADKVFLDALRPSNRKLLKEASDRFGKEKIALYIPSGTSQEDVEQLNLSYASLIIVQNRDFNLFGNKLDDIKLLLLTNLEVGKELLDICKAYRIYGITLNGLPTHKIMEFKQGFRNQGIPVFVLDSAMNFSDFKLNDAGLIPVIVQDYKTNEVLMMAYMNEEAYEKTIATGKMTYYSRSRKQLWVKGLTSGHYQYVKELKCDCDSDTLLAKVFQTGAACHTGNYSCFFNTLAKKEVKITNPLEIFQNVYEVILNRKSEPKEGSYTNYLFDKGIDKILKKLGEEATEIIIAAKNPDSEEIKYEIADFLYHMMVLMVEKEVTWEEITEELNRR